MDNIWVLSYHSDDFKHFVKLDNLIVDIKFLPMGNVYTDCICQSSWLTDLESEFFSVLSLAKSSYSYKIGRSICDIVQGLC